MLSLFVILIITLMLYWIQWHWSRRRLYVLASKLKAPPGISTLPLIGNAHIFFCKIEDFFFKMNSVFKSTDNEPFRFWLGPNLLIGIKNPVHLEKIMSSSKFAYKHELYVFMEKYLGDGLISASGLKPKYKIHRRIIQPLIDLQFVESCQKIFHNHREICMDKLNQYVDSAVVDVHNIIIKYFMDTVGETILGHNINSQQLGLTKFCQASIDMYDLGVTRLIKPWLHPDFIYNILPDKVKYDQIILTLNGFIQEMINESWKRRKLAEKDNNEQFIPIIDKLANYIEENPNTIDSVDFMNHLMTLFIAAADTLATVSSFAVLCFGMYPEYQKKAADEIRRLIGESPREVTLNEINKLTYLDMCIKDVMRLFPIAPYIMKRTLAEYSLDKWVIPKEAAIMISIFNLHYDESYWEHPHHFFPDHFLPEAVAKRHVYAYLPFSAGPRGCIDKWVIPKEAAIMISIFNLHYDESYWEHPHHFFPDHFLPEAVAKRHVYAYLPFSAGPRGCIGKTLANVELKLFLLNFLQRFEIEADGTVPDLELKSDISVRPKNGYNCRLKKRIWR